MLKDLMFIWMIMFMLTSNYLMFQELGKLYFSKTDYIKNWKIWH